jgi:copper(I)-binding protein
MPRSHRSPHVQRPGTDLHRKSIMRPLVFALFLLVAGTAPAEEAHLGPITVKHAWSRAMPPVSATGAAYLSVHNAGPATARLVAAESDAAPRVELHTHINDGGVMRMRQVPAIEVPPGETVALKPGGSHVMLMGLVRPLVEGESISLALRFEKAGTLTLRVPIMPSGHGGSMMRGQGHGHGKTPSN